MSGSLRHWIAMHDPLITFVYGQTFFVVGLAVFVQSRRHLNREFASALRWLAAFGIVHAFFEWGGLFLPMQAVFSRPSTIGFLRGFRIVLLALSFGFLFMFGADLLRLTPGTRRFARLVPAAALALWLAGPFALGRIIAPDASTWLASANILARYLLGFPGTVFAAWALHRYLKVHPSGLAVERRQRIAASSGAPLLAYGVMSGLIGPRAPFFPAMAINSESFTRLLVLPPSVFRTMAALLFMIAVTRALDLAEAEAERAEAERLQAEAVSHERIRTARDLHDGAIQRLYAAGLLVQSLRRNDADGTAIERGLSRLSHTIDELIREMRAMLSGPGESGMLADPARILRSVAEEFRQDTGMDIRWNAGSIPGMPVERFHHLAAILRESLSNVARHAGTGSAVIRLAADDGRVTLIVQDEGRGFPRGTESGYGLRDMNDRARLLDGRVSVTSMPGRGTTVALVFPVEGSE